MVAVGRADPRVAAQVLHQHRGAVAAPADTGGKGVLDAIDTFVPPSCDKAAARLLGLSFAGWNALASLVLAIVALRGALGKA